MQAVFTPTHLRGDHVLLKAGPLRLMLPAADVRVAGPAAARGARVIALSEHLMPLARLPEDRRAFTLLADGPAPLWLAWHAADIVRDVDLPLRELPPAARQPGSPIEGYVVDGELAHFTTGPRLAAHALRVAQEEAAC